MRYRLRSGSTKMDLSFPGEEVIRTFRAFFYGFRLFFDRNEGYGQRMRPKSGQNEMEAL